MRQFLQLNQLLQFKQHLRLKQLTSGAAKGILYCGLLVGLLLAFRPDSPAFAKAAKPALAGETYFNDDVTVKGDQVVDGDLVVYSGAVKVEKGGAVSGNLIVYDGDIDLQAGSLVRGNVTAWSGEISVEGEVKGSIANWSGDINLSEEAVVGGDVSAMSGDIQRDDNVVVRGKVVEGPGFVWPGIGNPFEQLGWVGPEPPTPPDIDIQIPDVSGGNNSAVGPVRGFINFILRLIGAAVFTAIAAALVAVVFSLRPEWVERIRTNVTKQTAYSGVVGAVVNLPLGLVAALLMITICLAPLALPPLLVLLAFNLIGLTGMAQIAGERLARSLKLQLEPMFVIALGAAAITGALSVLWAFGGCFRPLAWLAAFVVGSLGTGAFLLPWVQSFARGRSGGLLTASSGSSAGASRTNYSSPVAPAPAANVPPIVVEIGGSPATVQVETPPPAAQMAMKLETPAAAEIAPAEITPIEIKVEEISEASALPPAPEILQATEAAAIDDFTVIKGIGVVLDRRLKEAGVTTFAQLAALSPEQLAEIFDRPLKWVAEDDIAGQAQHFAQKK
jgi:predicted flap endonuclease-1-like 5' DNA nuclease/cytoskeletal protein CcmA (bactofilin family)